MARSPDPTGWQWTTHCMRLRVSAEVLSIIPRRTRAVKRLRRNKALSLRTGRKKVGYFAGSQRVRSEEIAPPGMI